VSPAPGAVRPGIVCAGGAVVDRHLHLLAPAVPGTSNPARAASSPGGVARNVAQTLAALGVPARLVSRVGDDDAGRGLLAGLAASGVDVGAVTVVVGATTAQYVAVLDPAGDLVLGVVAAEVLDGVTLADVEAAWPGPGEWLLADCNLAAPVLAGILDRARRDGTRVAVEAVSTPKIVRLLGAEAGPGSGPGRLRPLAGLGVLFCNADEAATLAGAVRQAPEAVGEDPAGAAAALVAAGADAVVLTLGAAGALAVDAGGSRAVPGRPARVVDVTGAGDALVAATLAWLAAGAALPDALAVGVAAATVTVESPDTVPPDLALRLAASIRPLIPR